MSILSMHLITWYPLMVIIIVSLCAMDMTDGLPGFKGKRMKTRKGREIMAYRGIPYALAAIGDLRFAPPVPIHMESPQYAADDDKGRCIQRTVYPHSDEIFGVEECLYLNVYTPVLPGNDTLPRYPVMVWFHGGGFQTGSGHTTYYKPTYLLDHDIVLVVPNYRLGPFGFLSTGDDVLPGNYGLKDQVVVLKWIQRYIAIFGGDVDCVTIAGHGAGAASVVHLMMAPMAKGLFHRAIAQSGSAFNTWAYQRPEFARKNAMELGERLGCPTKNSAELKYCLQQKRAEDILAVLKNAPGYALYSTDLFRPTLEKNIGNHSFLIRDPANVREMSNVPFMTGWSTHEGALLAASLFGRDDEKMVVALRERLPFLLPQILNFDEDCLPRHRLRASHKIYQYYMGDEKISRNSRMKIVRMLSDGLYNIGILETAERRSRWPAPLYVYQFGYQGSASYSSLYGDSYRKYGVAHGDDLMYLFPMVDESFTGVTMSKTDYEMVDIMTGLWYNFAKFGNPAQNPIGDRHITWPEVDNREETVFYITSPKNLTAGAFQDYDTVDMWHNLPCNAGGIALKIKGHDEL